MKQITVYLQCGVWFVSGSQKLYAWNIDYIACTCNKLMTSGPFP